MNINKLNKIRPKYLKICDEYNKIYNEIYKECHEIGDKILLEFGKIVPKAKTDYYGKKDYGNYFNLDWVQEVYSKQVKLIDDYFELSFWNESSTSGCDAAGNPEYYHDAEKIYLIQIVDEFNVDDYIAEEIRRYHLESKNHQLYLINKKEEERKNQIKLLELEIEKLKQV